MDISSDKFKSFRIRFLNLKIVESFESFESPDRFGRFGSLDRFVNFENLILSYTIYFLLISNLIFKR